MPNAFCKNGPNAFDRIRSSRHTSPGADQDDCEFIRGKLAEDRPLPIGPRAQISMVIAPKKSKSESSEIRKTGLLILDESNDL